MILVSQAYHYLAIARELPDKHGFEDQTWFAMVQLRTANVTATQLQVRQLHVLLCGGRNEVDDMHDTNTYKHIYFSTLSLALH